MEVKNTTAIYFPNKLEAASDKPMETVGRKLLEEKAERIPKEKLIEKVREMNEFLEQKSISLKFQLHEKLDIYYVQIVDTVTEEVLKEIPNKKFLDMYASIAEITGILIDKKL